MAQRYENLQKENLTQPPLMIMPTYIAVYGMKYGYWEGLQKVVNNYVLLHKDDSENQKGVYEIETIYSYPAS